MSLRCIAPRVRVMPFRSQAQRRFMYATDPKMAERFEKKTKRKKLPEKVEKAAVCHYCGQQFATPMQRMLHEERMHEGGASSEKDSMFLRSEPFDLAFQVLKERKSPEALAHKRAYDAEYQKDPQRVKYREQLNQERRRRGIYGSGDHMDVSHTKGGKLTLEPEHTNRARHFKERGTLRVV